MADLPSLKLNNTGAAVLDLEKRLKALGFDTGNETDKLYDAATVEAVKAFQRKRKLPVTGQVNLATWQEIICEELNDASEPGPTALAKKLVKVALQEHTDYDGKTRKSASLCQHIEDDYYHAGGKNLGFTSCTEQPWSAAFISYCVSQASSSTTNDFDYSASHAVYVHAAIKSADAKKGHWRAVPYNGSRLRLSDIVHLNRATPPVSFQDARAGKSYISHSAIVVELHTGPKPHAITVGGNESDAVSTGRVTLTPAGRVKKRTTDPYIALLRHI